jgi:hypothetical protein
MSLWKPLFFEVVSSGSDRGLLPEIGFLPLSRKDTRSQRQASWQPHLASPASCSPRHRQRLALRQCRVRTTLETGRRQKGNACLSKGSLKTLRSAIRKRCTCHRPSEPAPMRRYSRAHSQNPDCLETLAPMPREHRPTGGMHAVGTMKFTPIILVEL